MLWGKFRVCCGLGFIGLQVFSGFGFIGLLTSFFHFVRNHQCFRV